MSYHWHYNEKELSYTVTYKRVNVLGEADLFVANTNTAANADFIARACNLLSIMNKLSDDGKAHTTFSIDPGDVTTDERAGL